MHSATLYLRHIWRFRGLALALVRRNLKVRYQRSSIGFLWTLLNPTVTIGILILVFQRFLHIAVEDYWAFLVSGYFAWVFTMHTLSGAPALLSSHSYMTRSLAFPAEVLVVSGVASRLVEFVAELLLVTLVLAVFHHHRLPLGVALLPLVVALHVLLVCGLALPVASLSVFFDDVQHAVPAVLLLFGFLSPVYYPIQLVPEAFRGWYGLNPVAALLDMYHTILFAGEVPTLRAIASLAVVSVASAAGGLALFRWKRDSFAEIL